MQGIAAGAALKKHAAGASCDLKDLLVLTERRVEESLASFVSKTAIPNQKTFKLRMCCCLHHVLRF